MYKQIFYGRIIKYFFMSLFVVVSLNSMANTDKIENICEDIISQMVRIPDSNEHTGLLFGKYEVTQKQWETIMGYNPSRNSIGGNFPVDSVSLLECFEFIRRLNNSCTNEFLFRLPTENEWIYAALAGSNRDFGLGFNGKKSKIDNICWYRKNSGFCTHNVGEKQPNFWGLYDMHGNVSEITTTRRNGKIIAKGGSSCDHKKETAANAAEELSHSSSISNYTGFRLVGLQLGDKDEKCVIKNLIDQLVEIPGKNYMISSFEVSQEQWETIMGENPSVFTGYTNLPVERVSLNDCYQFIEKLNSNKYIIESKLVFRLPRREEWIHACLAGSTNSVGLMGGGKTGDINLMGWFGASCCFVPTNPVGQKQPNDFGLYDMHGNVWEWTSDVDADGFFIFVGGGARSSKQKCFAESWNSAKSEFWDCNLGFRLLAEIRE